MSDKTNTQQTDAKATKEASIDHEKLEAQYQKADEYGTKHVPAGYTRRYVTRLGSSGVSETTAVFEKIERKG